MTIRINPITPAVMLPLNPLKHANAAAQLDAGRIVNAKNVAKSKLVIRQAEVNNGTHKALETENRKYI